MDEGLTAAAVAGLIAGAAVALPLGAIGVLLVQQAISTGWRVAAAGALGVALVDFGYAIVAVLAGNGVSRMLDGHEILVRRVGAVLLVIVALRGLSLALRELALARRGLGLLPREQGVALPGLAAVPRPVGAAGEPEPVVADGVMRTGVRFVVLTAVNPMTAVYFVALAAGSPGLDGPSRSAAFVLGVLVASAAWQMALVSFGALAGVRLGRRAKVMTSCAGHLVVLGFAIHLAT